MDINNHPADLEIQKIIQNSWDVQNACNLSGVVHSFSRDINKLRDLMNARAADTGKNFCTSDLNEHIACKLYASKIMSLAGDLPLDLHCYGIKFRD